MKKIAYKFILVIGILVIFSLGALQILSTNIKSISSVSTQILEKQVQDMTLLQKINLDFKEIHRLTVCHTMSTIDRTMDKYEKNIADLKEDVQENMAAYKARITDDKVQVIFSGLESKCELFLSQVDETIKVSAGGDKEAATISINNTLDTIVVNLDSYIENLTSTSNEEFEAREAELMATAKASNSIIIFAMIFMVVAAIAIFFVANRMIVRPINMATKELQTITRSIQEENADLSKRLKIRTKDEISVLTSGINQFLEILESLIRNIRISSIRISEEQQEVFRCVEKTQDDTNTTSCTMEELAAGMEDVTATVSLVTNHVKEARDTVEKVSDDVREGFHFAEEMKNRADNLKQQAIESKHYAGEMMAGIDKALVQSVEDSRQINSITSLANEILGIASQTNLLALNASIEAARAGEAGKGFAVVADEIRQLADNSKTTANNIQQISQGVIESVSSLSENASSLLAFVNEKVMVDYDELENTGARYFNDATTVTDIINKISQGTHLINDIMKEVVESNESIAGTVEQNALGIGSVAVTTTELAENMREIVNALQRVQDVIDDLTRQAEIFRISDKS